MDEEAENLSKLQKIYGGHYAISVADESNASRFTRKSFLTCYNDDTVFRTGMSTVQLIFCADHAQGYVDIIV